MKTKACFLYQRCIAVVVLVMAVCACDLSHMQRCEWYLMPNPSDDWMARVDDGYIPVCARNLEINQENCNLQATLEFSEKHYGLKFRYSEIELDTSGKFPRKVMIMMSLFCGAGCGNLMTGC
jgi:hypothetical protein